MRLKSLFFIFLLFLLGVSFAQSDVKNITLVTRVLPDGEKVFAVVIEYNFEIDGWKLTPDMYTVEAKLGDKLVKRTIKRVYANNDQRLIINFFANKGKYVIIELDPKEPSAGTSYFNLDTFLSSRPKLEYFITQNKDLISENGNIIKSFKLRNTDEKHLVIDDFDALTYVDKELGVELPYRFYVPKDVNSNKKYPLVVFLHGAGERGKDNFLQVSANRGAVVWAEPGHQAEHPCFVLAPQCPPNSSWTGLFSGKPFEPSKELDAVYKLIKELIKKYNIDEKRIYITGLSMGGYGTWALLMKYPETFAAGIPICGGGNVSLVNRIKDIPIWVFHAEDDNTVPVENSRVLVKALVEIGSKKVKYTEIPRDQLENQGYNSHWSWIPAYDSEEVIDWLFEQSK